MKLLHHLLSSAVAMAVLSVTAVANLEGKAYSVDDAAPANGQGPFGPFRGPAVEHNFDRSELYPGPEESEDDTEAVPAAGEEYEDDLLPQALPGTGLDDADQATGFDREAFEDRVLAPDVFLEEFPAENMIEAEDGDAVQPSFDQELLEYTRHLRSLVDPPRPREPLALPLDDPEAPAVEPKLPEDSESKPNLRGPEQRDQL